MSLVSRKCMIVGTALDSQLNGLCRIDVLVQCAWSHTW